MTRIIAGSLGGLRIAVPPRGTRPTTDRVREALFSRLDHEDALRGARVIDAFAGSGALGLEALSRGAECATFVESDGRAAATIRANLRDLGLDDRATVVRERVRPFLEADEDSYDLALLDPPYDAPEPEIAATLAALVARLAPGAVVVLERSSRATGPAWPPNLRFEVARAYGETTLDFARAPGNGAPDAAGGSVEP